MNAQPEMLPELMLKPTEKTDRISAMDTIRGISLLGILLMNITGLGLYHAYDDPTVTGGATGWDLKVWWINSMFFEGTMRGMFSMLFGAGIVLFNSRLAGNINGVSVTDAFFRRLLWMFLFGIIHTYILLWNGEVLYPYAIVGMFVFSFRHWKPSRLIVASAVLLVFMSLIYNYDYYDTKTAFDKYTSVELKKKEFKKLTKEDSTAIETWKGKVSDAKPPKEKIDKFVKSMHKDYWSIIKVKAPIAQFMQSTYMYRYFFMEMAAMMLLGMAFLKTGIFRAAKSNKFYLIMAIIGYGTGLTVNYFETSYVMDHHFDILSMAAVFRTYDVGRVPTTIGHIAVIMLFIKSGILPFLQKSLSAVGQMALTNYVSHSIICNFIFMGYGLSLYGMLHRHQLYYIVFSIWIFQLIFSPIWLRYFRFGPLEWTWRSLTYWEKQPMKRENIRISEE
ncbi:DUF418 domain-containing protein [Dyadobacter sp. CY356]|uniref:DUF418 domain-containing protein n=1 Tax=Dyadobacter sp. CY356 TaxID=2906442 RepID=UPI001F3F1A5F|nr:DUF418 domain-containing protein [Dyadobacter sp. CY356]MCF0054266.1 DUF418 domain-containing protein [Dyadobacter sp. CY356]